MPRAARAMPVAVASQMSELTPAEEKYFESGGDSDPGETEVSKETLVPEVKPEPVKEPAKDVPAVEPATEDDGETEEAPEVIADAGKQPVKPPKGFVSNVALREEREKRREAELNFTKLNERLNVLHQLAQADTAKQNEPKPLVIPDINEDPVGHFQTREAMLETQLRQVGGYLAEQHAQRQFQDQVQQLTNIAQTQEAAFAKETPDYSAAADFVKSGRMAELKALGVDDVQATMQIQNEAWNLAAGMLKQGKNPAQAIYDIAKARGFKAPEPVKTNGAAAPAAIATTVISPAEQKLRNVAKGQEAGQSLGQVQGTATPPTTLESLLKLSDKDFAKATEGENWRKLFA